MKNSYHAALKTVATAVAVMSLLGSSIALSWANGAPYAPLALGGMEFQHNEFISIDSERLYISQKKVTVDYKYHSTANKSLKLDIIFPIPFDDIYLISSADVLVNGEAIKVEPRLYYKNIDITPYLEGTREDPEPLLKNNGKTRSFFARHNLPFPCEAPEEGEDIGEPCMATDNLFYALVWQQVFAPGMTEVQVSYTPGLGSPHSMKTGVDDIFSVGFNAMHKDERFRDDLSYRQVFCADAAVENALKRIREKDPDRLRLYSGASISYIWDTARYWHGPIKNFHLVIEKAFPEQIISFCPHAGTKTSPKTFEWKAKNFVPTGRLNVLFYPEEPINKDE